MPKVLYDELYIFSRPLNGNEINILVKDNAPPETGPAALKRTIEDRDRLAKAFGIANIPPLPGIEPMDNSRVLSFREIVPEFSGDGTVPGWFTRDGRYELAWPHPIAVFTIVPGDVDFTAEKLDIDTPPGESWDYITIEGNMNGMPEVLTDRIKEGDRFTGDTFIKVPQDGRFFYGTIVERGAYPRITLPFLKGYGAPGEFKGNVRIPLTGETRIHEVGLFDVKETPYTSTPGELVYNLREGGSLASRSTAATVPVTSISRFTKGSTARIFSGTVSARYILSTTSITAISFVSGSVGSSTGLGPRSFTVGRCKLPGTGTSLTKSRSTGVAANRSCSQKTRSNGIGVRTFPINLTRQPTGKRSMHRQTLSRNLVG